MTNKQLGRKREEDRKKENGKNRRIDTQRQGKKVDRKTVKTHLFTFVLASCVFSLSLLKSATPLPVACSRQIKVRAQIKL